MIFLNNKTRFFLQIGLDFIVCWLSRSIDCKFQEIYTKAEKSVRTQFDRFGSWKIRGKQSDGSSLYDAEFNREEALNHKCNLRSLCSPTSYDAVQFEGWRTFSVKHPNPSNCLILFKLKVLKISPQNINDSMLWLITDSQIKHLYIVQNENTPATAMPCSINAWFKFKRRAKDLRVHLILSSNGEVCNLLIQPKAPIYSIKCENVIDFILS